MTNIDYIEKREQYLAPYATKSSNALKEPVLVTTDPDAIPQTPFEKDKNHILQSTALKMLANKSQNLIFRDLGDSTSRLFHTLQVTEIASQISKGLRLNIDLTMAIALGHDVGHMPFSHNTQDAIDEFFREAFALKVGSRESVLKGIKTSNRLDVQNALRQMFYIDDEDYKFFSHQKQSFHVFHKIEPSLLAPLTINTQIGLLHNYNQKQLGVFGSEIEQDAITFEMLVVEISDFIAWANYDLEESIRKGFISERTVTEARIKNANTTIGNLLGNDCNERISRFISHTIEFNLNNSPLEKNGVKLGQTVRMSRIFFDALNTLRDLLYEQVLENDIVLQRANYVQSAVSSLLKTEIFTPSIGSKMDISSTSLVARLRELCDTIWNMSDYDFIVHLIQLGLVNESEMMLRSFREMSKQQVFKANPKTDTN